MTLASARRIHFVGVGGAGMSAIAKVLLEMGFEVTGSDLKRSHHAAMLEASGASVVTGHSAVNVEGADVVVFSAAIPEHNPELVAARDAGIPSMTRGEALAEILADRQAIVIAGTHGKTTTTSMIVATLRAMGVDPTYLVGGGLNETGTNARLGSSEIAIAESDESDGSFLLLSPSVAVITNVEADHVDHWSSMDELRGAFERFLATVRPDGVIVVPIQDADLLAAASASGRRVITFGDPPADVSFREVVLEKEGASFVIEHGGEDANVRLHVPGMHNVLNAVAAVAATIASGFSMPAAAEGLKRYRGVERRFQTRGRARGITVIDDYAHHPTEVKATLAAARVGDWRRVVAVFQPHRYSRTAAFSDEFGAAFDAADRVVITDIYGAGEQAVPGITGKLIADSVCSKLPGRPVAYVPHRADLISYLVSTARSGDALLTMGAGDITSVGEELLERLEHA